MNQPLFSVIVPIYNVEEYIHKCITSILNQTCKDFELILVDDGSPDNCPIICDEYAQNDSRIKVIHKANGGIVNARYNGVKVSTGTYVIFVDGDDWISQDYLERTKKIIDDFSPDIICYGHYLASQDNFVKCQLPYESGYYDQSKIINNIFPILMEDTRAVSFTPTLWAKAFLRELYTQNQVVDLPIKMGEDSACVKPCVYHANSMFISTDCTYYYRCNPMSVTNSAKAINWNDPQMRAQHLMNHINMSDGDFLQQLYRATVHSLFNVVVSQFNRKEKYTAIVKEIRKEIDREFYQEAISKAYFKTLRGKLMLCGIKYQLFGLMKLYNRMK